MHFAKGIVSCIRTESKPSTLFPSLRLLENVLGRAAGDVRDLLLPDSRTPETGEGAYGMEKTEGREIGVGGWEAERGHKRGLVEEPVGVCMAEKERLDEMAEHRGWGEALGPVRPKQGVWTIGRKAGWGWERGSVCTGVRHLVKWGNYVHIVQGIGVMGRVIRGRVGHHVGLS